MNDRVAVFARLLDDEQRAAIQADLDTLIALQDRKAELLAEIQAAGEMSRPEMTRLSAQAQSNLTLMRRLVGLYRGILQEDGAVPTYGADGRRAGPAPAR